MEYHFAIVLLIFVRKTTTRTGREYNPFMSSENTETTDGNVQQGQVDESQNSRGKGNKGKKEQIHRKVYRTLGLQVHRVLLLLGRELVWRLRIVLL